MFATPERALATQKAAFDTLLAAQSTAFAGFEKLVDLNLKVVKASFEEASAKAQEAFGLKDSQEALAFVSGLAQPSADKALAYSKHVYDIVSGVQNEFTRLSETQLAESQRALSEAVEQFAKNAPAGSESAVALLKSSLATATSAYESVSKAAKQAAEMTESNLTAAANATIKATSESSRAPRARRAAA